MPPHRSVWPCSGICSAGSGLWVGLCLYVALWRADRLSKAVMSLLVFFNYTLFILVCAYVGGPFCVLCVRSGACLPYPVCRGRLSSMVCRVGAGGLAVFEWLAWLECAPRRTASAKCGAWSFSARALSMAWPPTPAAFPAASRALPGSISCGEFTTTGAPCRVLLPVMVAATCLAFAIREYISRASSPTIARWPVVRCLREPSITRSNAVTTPPSDRPARQNRFGLWHWSAGHRAAQ